MKNYFSYCFIRYSHSVMLEEAINVGMVFLFPEQRRVVTKFPKKFKGLDCLYAGFDEPMVKQYFDLIQSKLEQFDGTDRSFTDKFALSSVRDYIYNNIIVDDESSIQISEIKSAVLYSQNIDKISEEIFISYFNHYKSFELPLEVATHKIMEQEISAEESMASQFEKLLVQRNVNVDKLFERQVHFKSELTDTEVIFDYAWNSDRTENFFKALNLNLNSKKRIQDRALALNGGVHVLDMENALPNNSKLNFVVAPPQPRLERYFDSAIRILEKSSSNTRVILEKDLPQYTEEVAQSL